MRGTPWTSEDVVSLMLAVESRGDKKVEPFLKEYAPTIGRTYQSCAVKYYKLTKSKQKPTTARSTTTSKPNVKLSTGQQLMQTILNSDITATSIEITPTGMLIKF